MISVFGSNLLGLTFVIFAEILNTISGQEPQIMFHQKKKKKYDQ